MILKLGKQPAKIDPRTFKLASILTKKAVILPTSFDCDKNLKAKIPLKMFGNDKWGDCVIVGRANQTLRFEYFEQKVVLPITDDEVLNEYWVEQGNLNTHPDNGLVLLDALNSWRKKGWTTSGKQYNIYAFAEIDSANHNEVMTGAYQLNGAYIGLNLPTSAQSQFKYHLRWDICKKNNTPGSWGGHCVYIVGWDAKGPICITWARKQHMTWAFWDKYCDEAYCVVDNKDNFLVNSPVDVNVLDGYLKALGN